MKRSRRVCLFLIVTCVFGIIAINTGGSVLPGARAAEPAEAAVHLDFGNAALRTLPAEFVAVALSGNGKPSFRMGDREGRRVLTDDPGIGGDVLYHKTIVPMASIEESYAFVYFGPGSVVEPFIVNAPPRNIATVEGLTTDLSASRPGNNSAGNIEYRYVDGAGKVQYAVRGRLRTIPYFYTSGHTYRVDATADGASGLLTTRVYDVALGPQAFDLHVVQLQKGLSAYPGIIARSGRVAVLDFEFGPQGQLPIRPHPARRAGDYINYLGYNADVSGPATSPLSLAFQRYFPQLLIKHVRVPDEPRFLPSINAVARYGIDADVLTGNRSTLDSLRSFVAALLRPPDSIELWNEPNNPSQGAAYDALFAEKLPAFAAQVARVYHRSKVWGPSVLPAPNGYPADAGKLSAALGPLIGAWNAHAYTLGAPENLGYGGFFSNACGTSKKEDCGWYGSPNYNDNISAVINPNVPGVTTEGAASYGSYPDICGHGNVDASTQQAYVERGMLYNFKLGHLRIFPYKFIDDGGCADGFGTYGIMSRLVDTDGRPSIVPKPAYVSLVYLNHVLVDDGAQAKTFNPKPLPYSLKGAQPNVEELLLAESDGSYRLILWGDAALWDFNANGVRSPGTEVPLVAEDVAVTFAEPMSATVYKQHPGTGVWTASEPSRSTSFEVRVDQYPLVVAISRDKGHRAIMLPQHVPTPGPLETPRALVSAQPRLSP